MRAKFIRALAPLVILAMEGRASSPVDPYPFVIAHAGAQHFFVMTPPKGEGEELPSGRCYRITPKGEFETAWTTSGWWSFPSDVFLSPDGKGLVRVLDVKRAADANGKLTIGDKPLIRFYQDGKPIKEVLVKDVADVGALTNNDFLESLKRPVEIIWAKEGARTSVPHLYSRREAAHILGPLIADRAAHATLLLELRDGESVFVFDTILSERLFFGVPSGRLLLRKRIEATEEEDGDPFK